MLNTIIIEAPTLSLNHHNNLPIPHIIIKSPIITYFSIFFNILTCFDPLWSTAYIRLGMGSQKLALLEVGQTAETILAPSWNGLGWPISQLYLQHKT